MYPSTQSHKKLAIKSIHQSTMSRNYTVKILYAICPLDSYMNECGSYDQLWKIKQGEITNLRYTERNLWYLFLVYSPDAKNPPKGATREANAARLKAWICTGSTPFRISSKWWCTWVGSPEMHAVRLRESPSTEQISTIPGIIFTKALGNTSNIWGGNMLLASKKIGSGSHSSLSGKKENLFSGLCKEWFVLEFGYKKNGTWSKETRVRYHSWFRFQSIFSGI